MLRKRHYTFLYVPDDHAQMRRVRLPRGVVLGGGAGLLILLGLALCFVAGFGRRPAGSTGGPRDLAAENAGLRAELTRLEQKVSLMHQDLAATFRIQETVASTVGLDTLGSVVQAVGIGGREPLPIVPAMATGRAEARLAGLDLTLDQMLRQAKVQRQGYQAILDTLNRQASRRDRIPSIRPVEGGWVTSGFGVRSDPFTGQPTVHEGADFSVPFGTEVHVTADGVVREVLFDRGFGHCIIVQHDGRTATRYAHLSRILVEKGATVRRGQVIALSGRSGRATSPHLHYELLVGGRPVDPLPHVLEGYARRR
ncbi:MAG: M23 family metallopeptidase [Candidatus Krumholzibacteriia bacterium]